MTFRNCRVRCATGLEYGYDSKFLALCGNIRFQIGVDAAHTSGLSWEINVYELDAARSIKSQFHTIEHATRSAQKELEVHRVYLGLDASR